MATWAQIDENNVVIQVLVTGNNEPNEGYDFLVENLGGRWVQASYPTRNGVHIYDGTPFRGNFPGVGFIYREDIDAFIQSQPYPSWVLNTEKYAWEAPVAKPQDGKEYLWKESTQEWVVDPLWDPPV